MKGMSPSTAPLPLSRRMVTPGSVTFLVYLSKEERVVAGKTTFECRGVADNSTREVVFQDHIEVALDDAFRCVLEIGRVEFGGAMRLSRPAFTSREIATETRGSALPKTTSVSIGGLVFFINRGCSRVHVKNTTLAKDFC